MDKLDKKLYPNVDTIYGPYTVSSGRKQLVFQRQDGSVTSKSFPHYLVERYLRKRLPDYTVDHIDDDFSNNDIGNIRLKPLSEHVKEDVKRLIPQDFDCLWCGASFTLKGTKLHDAIQNRKKGKAGPFCGRSCAGKYGAAIQHGKLKPFDVNLIKPCYYKEKHNKTISVQTGHVLKASHLEKQTRSKSFSVGRVCSFCWATLIVKNKERSERKHVFCSKSCAAYWRGRKKEKIDWPPTKELIECAEEIGFSALGRELGVSDNAIRKRIKNH